MIVKDDFDDCSNGSGDNADDFKGFHFHLLCAVFVCFAFTPVFTNLKLDTIYGATLLTSDNFFLLRIPAWLELLKRLFMVTPY